MVVGFQQKYDKKKVRTPKVANFKACNSSMEEQDKLHEILI